jgi:nucleotide-binding universal stress UspA family protein
LGYTPATMKKILLPCDFSRTAEEAFRFAVKIADKNESEIHILYVIDSSFSNNSASELSHVASSNGVFMQQIEQQLNEKFVALKAKHKADHISTFFTIELGLLPQNIEKYIKEKQIDLVTMGTNGASGLKELFVGSNTEKIIRNARVPVVAVPLGSNTDTISDIIFPVDPADDPSNYLKELRFIQNLFHAKLQLLWVNTPNIFKSDGEALDDLREFAEEYQLYNYKFNIRSDHTEQDGILRFASEINATLIFMPTHSRKGLAHWLTGSITENVVNHVQCPVWTCSI